MSRFASDRLNHILPYVPGEQPQDKKYIKLNTNENPYDTSESAVSAVTKEVLSNLKLYSDPESKLLVDALSSYYGIKPKNVLVTNGSDEALAFIFQAYGGSGVCFADVTYGFYGVLANLFDCPVETKTLKEDFTMVPDEYFHAGKTVIIANPNAQTGIALPMRDVELIIKNNIDNVVVIDQAYADFSDENVIPLTEKYDNLIVVNTFSKSRSLAGARVGYIVANEKLIEDIKKVKYSFHPYSVNTLSMLLATNAVKDDGYFRCTVNAIKNTRTSLSDGLKTLGFSVLPSSANFVMAKSDRLGGEMLYFKLKEKGILVRHFKDERIKDFIRITVGTDEQTEILLKTIQVILEEIQ